jgi:phosphatidate phosphatase APP1
VKNTADVTGGKTIAVLLQSISGASAINPLVAFYDTHGEKREVLFFFLSRTPHETFEILREFSKIL